DNAVDRMANLFHMAPEAAADMLELLMIKPVVADPGRHPIRTRASLWGLFYGRSMRCSYQADAVKKGSLRCPEWRFDSTKGDDKHLKDQPELAWHLDLVKIPSETEERREYVDDVDTKAVLLPNILDIDIFMALSCTRQAHSRIFAKMAVQGIIYCLWDQIMIPTVYVRLLSGSIDLFVQASWGLTNVGEPGQLEDTNAPTHAPMFWSIVTAGLCRDIFNLGWWYSAHHQKWKSHYSAFRKWQEDASADRPPSLHALWRPQAFWNSSIVVTELPLHIGKALFIWDLRAQHVGVMTEAQQALLTAITLLQFFKLVYMLRLTHCGKKVTTIMSAFFSGAISEMFVVTSLFFGSVCLAFAMLKRKGTATWSGLYLYRGLLFGDGDALDYMGLDPKEGSDGSGVRTSLTLAATLLFNVVILNLTVAVYSSEYDRLEREAELHFQRERAKYCCELLLGVQKLRLRSDGSDRWKLTLLKALALLAGLSGLALHSDRIGHHPSVKDLWSLRFLSAGLIAFAQVSLTTIFMTSSWFPQREDGQEGPENEHFLWICHRSDYNEDQFSSDELDKMVVSNIVDERIGRMETRMEQKFSQHISRLDEKFDSLSGQVDSKLTCLGDQMAKLLQLQLQALEAQPQKQCLEKAADSEPLSQ
ncbi:unnamed protein product, partial [Polarella glacialis]